MNNIKTESLNFIGSADSLLKDINSFLVSIKNKNPGKSKYHLVHALVFSKNMSETEIKQLNSRLSETYKANDFCVLGGDTSSGAELSIFISTIVF